MATKTHTAPGKAQSRPLYLDEKSALAAQSSAELPEPIREYIEERRTRLYELEALLKSAKQVGQGMDSDVDTLMDLGLRIVGEVNQELDCVNVAHAVGGAPEQGPGATVEPAPAIPAEALAAQVDRAAAFGATPQGEALVAADDALIEVVACLDVVIRSLDADQGCEHEVTVLRMAAQRLQAAQESIEKATDAGSREVQ